MQLFAASAILFASLSQAAHISSLPEQEYTTVKNTVTSTDLTTKFTTVCVTLPTSTVYNTFTFTTTHIMGRTTITLSGPVAETRTDSFDNEAVSSATLAASESEKPAATSEAPASPSAQNTLEASVTPAPSTTDAPFAPSSNWILDYVTTATSEGTCYVDYNYIDPDLPTTTIVSTITTYVTATVV